MAGRPDKRSREEALDRWRVQQRAAARAKLPLPDAQMQALFDMLDARFTCVLREVMKAGAPPEEVE